MAQSLMPQTTLHMPSKATVVTCIVVLHVVALTYLLYALYTAQRHAQHLFKNPQETVFGSQTPLQQCRCDAFSAVVFLALVQASSTKGTEGKGGTQESELRVRGAAALLLS